MKYRYAQQLGRVARDRVTESGTDLCENVLNSCEIVSKDIENSLALFHNIHRRLQIKVIYKKTENERYS